MKKICMLLVGGLLLAACVFAQAQEQVLAGPNMMFFQKGTSELEGKVGVSTYNYVYTTNVGDKELVKGAPYSATAVTESTQVLADGNRIVNKSSAFLARDGEGRTRREMNMGINALPGGLPKMVMISDPVAKTETVLNEQDETARVMKGDHGKTVFVQAFGNKEGEQKGEAETFHRAFAIHTASGPDADPVDKAKMKAKAEQYLAQARSLEGELKHEDLGTEVIEGISCTGTRETRTIAAGAIGNERPIEITSETWKSVDLHTTVLSKHNDPRFGETVYKLTDIKRGEPDAALFQVPANYKTLENGAPLLKP
jgi:hypothetical protein